MAVMRVESAPRQGPVGDYMKAGSVPDDVTGPAASRCPALLSSGCHRRGLRPGRHRSCAPARPFSALSPDASAAMSDDNQTVIPRPFIELFMSPGASKPNESRSQIAQRYELCEDMAQMLTEHATAKRFEMGATASRILDLLHQGLLIEGSVVTPDEAGWVTCRLAELLGWPLPDWAKTG